MRVEVSFAGDRLDLDIADDRLVAVGRGPDSLDADTFRAGLDRALEAPQGFPALRQAVVPGDRVVIPVTPHVPALGTILDAVVRVLEAAGVAPESVTVLWPDSPNEGDVPALPPGVSRAIHDPSERSNLAYLATTSGGRRVYLDRLLTDADFVLPIGGLAFNPRGGLLGPWSALFPQMSDEATRAAYRSPRAVPDASAEAAEANEVGWLLGCQLQLGVLVGRDGPAGVVTGLEATVREQAAPWVDASWTLRAPEQAGLVLAGVGAPGATPGWPEIAAALATAARLVRPGGKIALLSDAEGPAGPALRHYATLGDRDVGPSALRGREADADLDVATRVAEALARTDVYLLSRFDPDFLDDLGIVPLSRPEEARRLAVAAPSCTVASRAERVRALVADEPS